MSDDLVDRLLGIYRVPITDGLGATGGGEEPDNPNEFVRTFPAPPIQHEAAATITQLRADLDAANEEVHACGAEREAWKERAEKAEAALDAPNRHAYKVGIAVGKATAEADATALRAQVQEASAAWQAYKDASRSLDQWDAADRLDAALAPAKPEKPDA